MREALALASLGRGRVEPNPMVGCVIVREGKVVGKGYHRQFGGAHAEVDALEEAREQARGADLFVTLEPCCHYGKTPPCSDAILQAGVARVVVAMADPFPKVAGGGIAQLREAGIRVEVGLLEDEARRLNRPFLMRIEHHRPWVVAKWAMTLDGKIATRAGSSRWISGEASRKVVHDLRGNMDAILVGSRTALEDDPLLTVRPPGNRIPLRIVFDSQAVLPRSSRLVRSARETPLLLATGEDVPDETLRPLAAEGCETLRCPGDTHAERLESLLRFLASRSMTNLMVEGGGRLLGAMLDRRWIDEVHVFIAPKLVGGAEAVTPIAGMGIEEMPRAWRLGEVVSETIGPDTYVRGVVRYGGNAFDRENAS
jgi:diaminohydroxyphosphoribosylaminopyrimidine deaminase/5-amino-6-(5-phosphoribosylamino)uracil reductase